MQVHLTSGNNDVIANGEAFLFDPYGDLTIQVDDGNGFQVKIVMKFTEDHLGERKIETDVENDSLIITCVNFSGVGTGVRRPTQIADVNGKKVFFLFSTDCTGDDEKIRSVKYTVFLQE